jgi:hypothetical protein
MKLLVQISQLLLYFFISKKLSQEMAETTNQNDTNNKNNAKA